MFKLLAGNVEIPYIHQHQVIIRAAGHKAEAAFHQLLRQDLGVFHDLLRIGLEFRLQCLAEAHGLGGDDMLQRAALGTREHSGVDLLVNGLVVAEDQAAPGTAKGLVGSGDHHIGVGNGGGMDTGGHQAGDVGHVHHEIGAHGVSDLPEFGKVDDAGIGGGTGHDELGPAFLGNVHQLVIVDHFRLVIQTIGDHMEVLAGDVHGTAVAEMAAVGQIHAQHRVAGLEQGKEHRQVGVGTGMWLDVGIIAAEQLAGPLAGDLLRHIHGVAAAVVALAGVTLGVLVGQAGAHSQHDGGTDDVLGGNEFDVAALTGKLLLNGSAYLGIVLGNEVHVFLHHGAVLL